MAEGVLCHHMPVVIGPAPEFTVQLPDQLLRGGSGVGFDQCPDFSQEALDRGLGRFDQELALVLAYVESEEIEAVVYVRDVGLLFGKLQTSHPEEGNHGGLHPLLENLF